jgi:hypothetical protein
MALSKSSKTAAIIAAVNTNKQNVPSPQQQQQQNNGSSSATDKTASSSSALVVSEEEVRKYLARKPMTTKELLHKFRTKTMSKEELCQRLKTILDKINAKMIEKDGINYLSLP